MAADQRRKRLNSASVVSCNSRDQYRAKRKNKVLRQYDSNVKSHISLHWDVNQKRVIAKREQIGISWRDLRPFIDSYGSSQNVLADIYDIPPEIHDLENLREALSYEVWETHLSENEKNHLKKFLPIEAEAEQVVQTLLSGENFHFGNQFLKWGASVCSGDLHPDTILQQDQRLKIEKKAFYEELHKYHNDMIVYLLSLKERFASCRDPENEFSQKIWRSRNDGDKRISSCANDSGFHVVEDNVALTLTSESCSWIADEKACSSDNQNSSVLKGGEFQNRVKEKSCLKDKIRNPFIVSDDMLNARASSRKEDKLQKQNVHCSDGAKYMSYFKISKKQHEIVKSMKQSGKSIQSRSLNRVLGNIDNINVQPYEVFVEEEQKKLHEHWLQLVKEALPAAYANWREFHSQRLEVIKSLEQDLKSRVEFQVEDDEYSESEKSLVHDQIEIGAEDHVSTSEDEEKSVSSGSPLEQQSAQQIAGGRGSVSSPPQEQQSPQQIAGCHEFNPMDIDSGQHVPKKSDNVESSADEYSENEDTADVAIHRGVHLASNGDVWPTGNMPNPYYESTASHQYTSAGETLVHPQVDEEQQRHAHLIDLESDLRMGDTGKNLLHKQSDDASFRQSDGASFRQPDGTSFRQSDGASYRLSDGASFRQSDDASFGSYPNQDRTELLQSLFKGQGVLPYHHEQKQTRLDFQPSNNMLMGGGQFPVHFQEQPPPSLPIEQGQKRDNEAYIQQNIPENIFSDGGRYLIPRQESLTTPVNIQDWAVNSVRLPQPLQPHLNGGELLNQNWFSGEHQVRGVWSGSDSGNISSQSIGSGSNGDQSLFSVLSHCNQLHTSSPFHSVSSTEQLISLRNYGMVGGVTPRINNVMPQATHSLDYMSGREAAAASSVMPDEMGMGWMGLPPHQGSSLHDPMGKPYLRSWNQ
ncbi:hypothetical protein FNV43_RR22411 [Rhamnella rubrinervis]|uniref:DEUBAD domain-containing protein n=1 Tax=Rhamnella rubrinervis TaxID=2594499 RepID=A0A8K0GR30_9ROSA|nr:hypothetical protein FNV43_RR22411 [Rhamnella rubrinervis]